ESNCECRKPSPKMLLEAQKEFNIDMKHSWMVGDKKSDIDAGKKAGVGKTVYIVHDRQNMCNEADYIIEKVGKLEGLVRKQV
ncbi:MAG: D,D-heptose 1,7-bisphosphate phosphatase, partial [Sulfurospirillum sp.]